MHLLQQSVVRIALLLSQSLLIQGAAENYHFCQHLYYCSNLTISK